MTDSTCPHCSMENVYSDGSQYVCPDCFNEWPLIGGHEDGDDLVIRDSNGTPLVKGSSTTLKKGTKAKNIRLREGDHEVDCKIDNVSYMLKACFLKKA